MKTLAEGGERRRRWRFVHVGYRMFYMNIHPSTCGFALRQNDDIVSYKKLHVTALCPVLWYFLVTSSATPLQSLAVAASSNLILGIKERQRRRANHFKNIFERKCRECNNASQTKWLQGSDTPTAPLPEKQARASSSLFVSLYCTLTCTIPPATTSCTRVHTHPQAARGRHIYRRTNVRRSRP